MGGERHLKGAEQCQSRSRRERTRMLPTNELTELNSEENEERDKDSLLGTGSKNKEFEAQTATTKNSRRLVIFNGEVRSRANATAAPRSRQLRRVGRDGGWQIEHALSAINIHLNLSAPTTNKEMFRRMFNDIFILLFNKLPMISLW